MKTIIVATAIFAIGLGAIPAVSHAADGAGGFFVNGALGQANADKGIYNDNDSAEPLFAKLASEIRKQLCLAN